MDKLSLNNQVVLMRKPVSNAVVHVMRQLIKKKKMLASKMPKKADAIQEQIMALKGINKDEVSKFALTNKKSLSEGMSDGLHLDARDKVLLRLATHKVVEKSVCTFREGYPDWEKEIPLLLKVLGIKSKKKKQKEKDAGNEVDTPTTEVGGTEITNKESVENETSEEEGSSRSRESEDERSSEDDQRSEENENSDDCEPNKDSEILSKKKKKVEYESASESECILKIKKGNSESKQRSPQTKDLESLNSSKQTQKTQRTATTDEKMENKVTKKSRISIKKPSFVVSDKVCGTAEVRKLKLDLLDSEEIPISKNSEDVDDDEDSPREELSTHQDSFFLRGDGSESGEEEEVTHEGKKENYNDLQCGGGLNRRQRRNAMFGREDDARPKRFAGKSQFPFGSSKHHPSSQHSRGYHGDNNSRKDDLVHTSHGRTNSSRSNVGEEDASALHPSWAAKRKLNQQTVSTFQGKKIKFD